MKRRREETGMLPNTILLFYILVVSTSSIALFLYGFFPYKHYDATIAITNDIPKFVENVRVKSDTIYKPIVKKVIIMLIDALRYDFVVGPIGQTSMPAVNKFIGNSSACLFKANVQTPTVTSPRLKAITTGTVPSFIDMAFNLQSKPVAIDNVLLQAKQHGHKLIFFGDDTWINLFPNMFERRDGTSSFYVLDFTEVDNNVTRHIHKELNNDDWSIMILHYSGLDHIGHVMGPFHPLIKTKLKEMDAIAAKIGTKILDWNQNGKPSLFMMFGDHGMKDSGGHGGATIEETTVPLVTIGTTCSKKDDNQLKEIEQVDIAVTLAVMLGVPIPYASLGTVSLDMVHLLPMSRKLFILYYNSKQVLQHFKNVANYESHNAYQKYTNAVKLHLAWLNTSSHPNDMVDDIILTYLSALKEMRDVLTKSVGNYDIPVMVATTMFLLHILWMLNSIHHSSVTVGKTVSLVAVNIILWLVINYLCGSRSTVLYSNSIDSIILKVFIVTILFINCHLIASRKYWCILMLKSISRLTMQAVLYLGALFHTISFFGSSFVEEEHQTWYFFWGTLVVILLYDSSRKLAKNLQGYTSDVETCIKLFMILVGHRVLRKLNSTGDKFAHVPDISGWLEEQEVPTVMTFLVTLALLSLIWIGYVSEDAQYKRISVMFNTVLSGCIYLRHIGTKSVLRIPWYPPSRGIYEVHLFWAILIVVFGYYIYRLIAVIRYKRENFMSQALFFIVQGWIAISALLHRPHNIILLPVQVAVTSIVSTVFRNTYKHQDYTFLYILIGNTFYFYQGNSNNLATVDITTGFIGMESYRPFLGGILVFISTSSACVLSYLILIYIASLERLHDAELVSINGSYLSLRLLPATIYTVIATLQRHHLFVWSVFSPKLLYEATHVTILCVVMFIVLILSTTQCWMNNYCR